MKKLFILVLSLIIGCSSGFVMNFSEDDVKNEKNIIPNSGFEDGDYNYTATPEKWIIMDKPTKTVFWDKEIYKSGEKSLKITYPQKTIKLISDSFAINPGAVYFMKAYIKSDKVTSKQVNLDFIVFDKEGKKINQFKKNFYVTANWTPLTLTAGFFKSGAKFARVIVSIPRKPDGIFWIDDVEAYNIHSFKKRK